MGSHASNDLVLEKDDTVSRFHAELSTGPRGLRVRDLGSRNGTAVDGVPVLDAFLRDGGLVTLGNTVLRFALVGDGSRVEVAEENEFGSLVGSSVAMRQAFVRLGRVAATEVTVLLKGETGTGKEGAAESIHQNSPRRDGPFLVVDCGSVPEELVESELFGHEKGAFTGAGRERIGVFEEAAGGTVFLDELGELPVDLQRKLLRVLERRQIRRIGANRFQDVDVRVIASTNRDLRAEVNEGRFREDLYYRVAVVKIRLPPLRERPEDLPLLVERLLTTAGASEEARSRLMRPEVLAKLRRGTWPGNVRQLRNYLERCLVFEEALPLSAESPQRSDAPGFPIDTGISYGEARRRAIEVWERAYIEVLLERYGGTSRAARAVGMNRQYLYRLLRRHGLR